MLLRKILISLLLVITPGGFLPLSGSGSGEPDAAGYRELYAELGIAGVVGYEAFERAMKGYARIHARREGILTLIDFSKPSTTERLCVIDVEHGRLLFRSHVAHGRGSGGDYATRFSNQPNSHCTSLGFYLTGETYKGGNGYSLRLDGLEKGINDRARERAVVIHGADYCNPDFMAGNGRLGRSFGCPALPEALNRPIIDAIKGGTLLYIYAADGNYVARSAFLPHPASGVL